MGKAISLTEQNFDQEVLQSDVPVLVDFWAPWCGPCRMIAPTIEQLAEEFTGQAKVCKLNVDESTAIAARYSVTSIPTIIIFKNGQIVDRYVGAQSKERLRDALVEATR